jgi:hypothetical protein
MEPSDPAASPSSCWEPPCAIHGMGRCPYSVAQWQPVPSSPGEGEGEEAVVGEEEEEVVEEEEDELTVVAIIDKDDESEEVIPVPESMPSRSPYNQTVRIRIGPRGRPTKTLAPRDGARETERFSSKIGSEVWPPPCPHPHRATHQAPHRHHKTPLPQVKQHLSRAPSGAESSTPLPTLRDRAARRLGICLNSLECHGGRGWASGEWRGREQH